MCRSETVIENLSKGTQLCLTVHARLGIRKMCIVSKGIILSTINFQVLNIAAECMRCAVVLKKYKLASQFIADNFFDGTLTENIWRKYCTNLILRRRRFYTVEARFSDNLIRKFWIYCSSILFAVAWFGKVSCCCLSTWRPHEAKRFMIFNFTCRVVKHLSRIQQNWKRN